MALPYDHYRYEAESFWDLFGAGLPIPEALKWNFPYFSPCQRKNPRIDQLLGANTPFICLFPGATIKERLWPESRWAKLADFLQNAGYKIVLVGGRAEITICERIILHSRIKKTIDFSGKLTLLETSGLLERSALLISTDSGILHVGVLCDTHTVSLFGSGISSKWGPKGERHRIINRKLACSPCTRFGETPPCPNGVQCMKAITVNDVINATSELLSTGKTKGNEYKEEITHRHPDP